MRIFISYSRRDRETADAVVDALTLRDFEVLIDRRDLEFGEKWQAQLSELIRLSDTVIWLVSPWSIHSEWVNWELDEVRRRNKRLVPVMVGDTPRDRLPRQLGEIHILPAEGLFDPSVHVDALAIVLDTDRDWLREATRLGDRAHEWIAKGRAPALLLRASALGDAEVWKDNRPNKAPAPSEQVLDLILSSRAQATRRQRTMTIASVAAAIGASVLAGMAYIQSLEAIRQRNEASAQKEKAEQSEVRVLANWETAQTNQVRLLRDLVHQRIGAGDVATARLLAIELAQIAATLKDNSLIEAAQQELHDAYHAPSSTLAVVNLADADGDQSFKKFANWLAIHMADGSIELRSQVDGALASKLATEGRALRLLSTSADGKRIATRAASGEPNAPRYQIWDSERGTLLHDFESPSSDAAIAFAKDDAGGVAVVIGNSVELRDTSTLAVRSTFERPPGRIEEIAVRKDRLYIVTKTDDGATVLTAYGLDGTAPPRSYPIAKRETAQPSPSPAQGVDSEMPEEQSSPMHRFALGETYAVFSFDREIKVFDILKGELAGTIPFVPARSVHRSDMIHSFTVTPDESKILTFTDSLKAWTPIGDLIATVWDHVQTDPQLSYSTDKSLLFVYMGHGVHWANGAGDVAGAIELDGLGASATVEWRTIDDRDRWASWWAIDQNNGILFAPDDVKRPSRINFWDLRTREQLTPEEFVLEHVQLVKPSPGGEMLAVATEEGSVYVLNVVTRARAKIFHPLATGIKAIEFTSDNGRLIVEGAGVIALMAIPESVGGPAVHAPLQLIGGRIYVQEAAACSGVPGRYLAYSLGKIHLTSKDAPPSEVTDADLKKLPCDLSQSHYLRIHRHLPGIGASVSANVFNNAMVWSLEQAKDDKDGHIHRVLFDKKGRVFVALSFFEKHPLLGRSLTRTTRPLDYLEISGPDGRSTGDVLLTPNGKRLLQLKHDGLLTIFEIEDGTIVLQKKLEVGVDGPSVVSPDGTRLALSWGNGRVTILALADGRELANFKAHWKPITHLGFNSAGDQLFTASQDGDVRLWGQRTGATSTTVAKRLPQIHGIQFGLHDKSLIIVTGRDEILELPISEASRDLVRDLISVSPHCLGPDERATYYLPPRPPCWCLLGAEDVATSSAGRPKYPYDSRQSQKGLAPSAQRSVQNLMIEGWRRECTELAALQPNMTLSPARAEAWESAQPSKAASPKAAKAESPPPDTSMPNPKFDWPASGRVVAHFNDGGGLTPDGILIEVEGHPTIKAVEAGTVVYVGNELKNYGNLILISHPGGFLSAYANLAEILVKKGDKVTRSQPIGKVGEHSEASAPPFNLHFEIRQHRQPIDPEPLLSPRATAITPDRAPK